MAFDLAKAEKALSTGLILVQDLAPLAALGGPSAGAIGATVAQVAGLANALVTEAESDATVLASGDLTQIKALQAQLQDQDAALASQVDAS